MTNKKKRACIEVRELCFSYRDEPVLRDVSFAVYEGDFTMITGENGAGKSTLLRLLLGELAPDSGEAFVMGSPASRFRDWPRVGYVPQSGVSMAEGFPATAAEVVGMGLYRSIGLFRMPGAEHKRRIKEALAAVGMESCAGRSIGKLSGGQVQRVLIARALAGNSELLLLDEPATGVDSASARALYGMLCELRERRGLTVAMVSHDVARAGEYVTRTLCLEHGSMVELDRAQLASELERRHKHPDRN